MKSRSTWIFSGVVSVTTIVFLAYLFWPVRVDPATPRTGDPALLAQLGTPDGFHRMSVAVVDPDSDERVRFAHIGADARTPFEAGSVTKALTGLALADAVHRGELSLADPVAKHLDVAGSPIGDVTLRELATHHSGLPRLGTRTWWRGLLAGYTGANPYRTSVEEVVAEARAADTDGRGTYEYSNLGAAVTGQATAAAAGTDYGDLMRTRVFEPLRMSDTVVAETEQVPPGLSARGRTREPWLMDGYAPAGGLVTTSGDLAKLCTAVLRGNAPGMAALEPVASSGEDHRRIGLFWQVRTPGDPRGGVGGSSPRESTSPRVVTWHNGRTGGYAAFLGFDRDRRRAVVVLSDVSKSVDELAVRLLLEQA